MDIKINKAGPNESLPIDLLLLADPSEEMISKYLNSGETFVAKLDDKIVGGFILLPISEGEIEIKNIAVYPEYQKKGLGKELMKYAIRTAKMEAYDFLIIKTADSSRYQISFYEKLKFKLDSTIKGHYIQYYKEPIIENGLEAVDQLVFRRSV
ncbi:MAG: GNAT family N-acetyltransferase [Cyclobacteriaceae bacterium]